MIIVGIDPGTLHLGWGVIRAQGTRLVHLAHGVVDTSADQPLTNRLVEIDDALEQMLQQYQPDQGAVESLFFAKDAQAAAKLGHARGVVLLRLTRAGVGVSEYPPARVKRAITGHGQADKRQVGLMIRAVLGLAEVPRPDAADALAIAVTHARIARIDAALQMGRVLPEGR